MPELYTPQPGKSVLTAQNLHRFQGEHCVVDDISLELARGQVLGVLGLNGAGKSSTLRLLCGMQAPDHGKVMICGHLMADAPLLAKQHLGYLPENPPLYRDMRVDDYLQFAGKLRGLRRTTLKQAVQQVKDDCDLGDVGRRIIGKLSKGFQQRVGIAQAIIHRPAVIILDEPSSGLDPEQMREIRELIQKLAPQHGIIFSTHLLAEATAVCTDVCVIHHGRLIATQALQQTVKPDTTTLTVKFRQLLKKPQLLRLPGVIDAIAQPGQRWSLQVQSSQQEQLLPLMVQQGWNIMDFGPQVHSLEHLFASLIRDDRPPEPVQPADYAGSTREQSPRSRQRTAISA